MVLKLRRRSSAKRFTILLICRYDYENVDSASANLMMAYLEPLLPAFVGQTHNSEGSSYKVALADNFQYTDPVDGSVAKKQVGRRKNITLV